MAEQDLSERQTPEPETAEQIGQQLLEFVESTEFGKPEFQAVSDYFQLQALYESHQIRLEQVQSKDGSDRLSAESDLRSNDFQIAFLEFKIEQNKSILPGYDKSYKRVDRALDDMIMVSSREADEKYADPVKQKEYRDMIYTVATDAVKDIIDTKKYNS
jgi:hypothetical protein